MNPMPRKAHSIALRTCLVYAIAGCLWIVLSDRLVAVLTQSATGLAWVQTYKGWAFVIVTAALLYVAVRSQLIRHEQSLAEREKIEADLRRHRERLQLATHAGNVGLWDYDLRTHEIFFSPEWKQQIGYADAEVPNRIEEWHSRMHPADRARVLLALDDCISNPEMAFRQEFRLRHKDGTYRWLYSQGALERDGGGTAVHLMGSQVDITPSKQAEVALRERAEINSRLAHIAAVVPGAIISYQRMPDGSHVFPYASRAVEEIYGFTPDQLAADASPVFERTHPDDIPRVVATIEESARTMGPWRCDFRFQHPTKGEVWIEGFSLPEKQPNDSLLWNGFVMDITSRKEAELRVHQLNRLYALLSAINQTIVRVRGIGPLFESVCSVAVEKGGFKMAWVGRFDPQTEKVIPLAHATQGSEPATGELGLERGLSLPATRAATTREHVICNDIEHQSCAAGWRETALSRGFRACAAFPFNLQGGDTGVLSLYSSKPEVFDAPEVQLLDELAMDLSFAVEVNEHEAARLRTEASLRENEERFRQLAENVREVFWLSEPVTGRLLYVSPVYETLSGCSVESLYSSPEKWLEHTHPDDRARMRAFSTELQRSENNEVEFRLIRPDGAVRWVRTRAFPVRDASGNVYRIAGITEDITDRKQLEDQFFRAQRLEAIGTLASGIAHDLNNILAPIMMCAPLLRMGLPPTEFEKMLGTIESSTRRGADLVRQLLVFGRGIEGGRGPVRPKDLVAEIIKITCETFPKNIVVTSEVSDPVWPVIGDATQLHQVLLNLCVNARDAMPEGGELRIKLFNVEVGAGSLPKHPNAKPGPHVCFSVHDSGTGIAPEHVEKIFDPFFTTKAPGKGTGLGLSTVMGIVKSHGGFVQLDTEVGRGSRFDIYIPAHLEDASPESTNSAAATLLGHGELVLLVDDEQSIREVVADILTRHNYRVLMAEDGFAAEQLFSENASQVALVLTDLDMPRMDGMRLIEAVRKRRRDMPVIVSSGLRSGRLHERTKELETAGVTAVLAKPYAAPELLSTVYAALSG